MVAQLPCALFKMSATVAFTLAICLSALALSDCARWKPTVAHHMFYQLGKSFNLKTDIKPKVKVYVVDGFDTPTAVVKAMLKKKLVPVCYISAGSAEDWRPDYAKLPKKAIGKQLDGWPGEYWLDIRSPAVRNLVAARIKMCKRKGYLAVDPDNVDGYTQDSGFPLTANDQLAFNKFLATTAHASGLSIALKNDSDQLDDLLPYFDFAVNEQCWAYDECDKYAGFIAAKKPVYNVEYNIAQSKFSKVVCPKAAKLGIQSSLHRLILDSWWLPCKL
jgi:hypothetical protein